MNANLICVQLRKYVADLLVVLIEFIVFKQYYGRFMYFVLFCGLIFVFLLHYHKSS
jgi:hypothetical protein